MNKKNIDFFSRGRLARGQGSRRHERNDDVEVFGGEGKRKFKKREGKEYGKSCTENVINNIKNRDKTKQYFFYYSYHYFEYGSTTT